MKTVFSAFMILLTSCGYAQAEGDRFSWDDGHFLAQMCESTSLEGGAYCHGYIVGVLDIHAEMPRLGMSGDKFEICLPENASKDMMKATITQYLQEHPDKLQYSAPNLVLEAVQLAFPC